MKRTKYLKAALFGAAALLVLPAVAGAQDETTIDDVASSLNTTWVIVAAVLVMFMQAGFALLEIGFSRMKNAGAGVAKILTNFSIASLAYWAVGFALAFGGAGTIAGDSGFFLDVSSVPAEAAQQFPFLEAYPSARRRSCSSSSCSARCRWRSCGAQRWSGSSTAPT